MNELLLIISDIFSVITVALCLILKVPQVIRLVKSRQAIGISLRGLLLELLAYTITMTYNYTSGHALLTYLEYPIIVLQEYVLIAFVLHYKNYKPKVFLMILTIYMTISVGFIYYKSILRYLLPLTTPVGAISKIIQLFEILSKKNASSVSIFTWFLSFFTNATRIYTVYMDSADFNLMLNLTVSSILSGLVTLAAFYYQNVPVAQKKAG